MLITKELLDDGMFNQEKCHARPMVDPTKQVSYIYNLNIDFFEIFYKIQKIIFLCSSF